MRCKDAPRQPVLVRRGPAGQNRAIAMSTFPALSAKDIEPARQLLIELRTRIATQELHYRAGDEETAAESLHKLFPRTRELLAKYWEAHAFEIAAEFLLNRILRPNTARWHRRMVDGAFQDERTRRLFRYELQQLQPKLREFADLLELLSAQKNEEAAAAYAQLEEEVPMLERPASLGGKIEAGIAREVAAKEGKVASALGDEHFAQPADIDAAEHAFIHARRRSAGTEFAAGAGEGKLFNAAGLCLSGGGIRSATFCLGIVQVLAREGLLAQFDYLSTVSGGGYLGSFLSSCLGTEPTDENDRQEEASSGVRGVVDKVFNAVGGRESASVRHLRNNSRYLFSGGIWGRLKIAGLIVTGILANILLMLPLPLIGVLVVSLLFAAGYWNGAAHWLFVRLFFLFALGWLALPLIRNRARGKPDGSRPVRLRSFWEAGLIILGLVVIAAGALLLVPPAFAALTWVRDNFIIATTTLGHSLTLEQVIAAATTLAPIVLGLFAARAKSKTGKKWLTILFGLSGPLLALMVFLVVGERTIWPAPVWRIGWVWAVTILLLLWGYLLVDINDFSPHTYYRNRLCECYLVVRKPSRRGVVRQFARWILHGRKKDETYQQASIGTVRHLKLSEMNANHAAPYHLVNTAVNLPASREPNLRGRDCDFFVFSRDYCGGPVCGYIQTRTLEKLDPKVDLGTAMAVSGAAASSNMGVHTIRHLRFLLTLLNVRLGYWLRNPAVGVRTLWNAPGPQYLLREMTGWMHEKTGYLNLSDGGHIENLALYEMLRRRCKFVVVVDGGMEPGMECADLMLAQRYAQIDLGVELELDLADLALNPARRSRAYAAFGKIRYSARDDGSGAGDLGWMVYLKLAQTGGEPGYVVDYARQYPDFPHQTTGDQDYDEAQFEAYRRLGECAAASLFRPEISRPYYAAHPDAGDGADGPRFDTLESWFGALAQSLLPDNDVAFDG